MPIGWYTLQLKYTDIRICLNSYVNVVNGLALAFSIYVNVPQDKYRNIVC